MTKKQRKDFFVIIGIGIALSFLWGPVSGAVFVIVSMILRRL